MRSGFVGGTRKRENLRRHSSGIQHDQLGSRLIVVLSDSWYMYNHQQSGPQTTVSIGGAERAGAAL